MISFKDIPMLMGLGASVVTGSVYVHDLRRDTTELGVQFRSHVAEQQEVSLMAKKWQLEDRIKANPDDIAAQRELQDVNRLIDKNAAQQEQLKKEK